VVYKRVRPIWTLEQQDQAQQATERALWLFSNAEALGHLTHLLPQTDWQHTAALATHPRVARAVQAVGFANVTVCRPHVADVLTAVAHIGEGRSNGS
jgi:uroporphyrinogen-III synthase